MVVGEGESPDLTAAKEGWTISSTVRAALRRMSRLWVIATILVIVVILQLRTLAQNLWLSTEDYVVPMYPEMQRPGAQHHPSISLRGRQCQEIPVPPHLWEQQNTSPSVVLPSTLGSLAPGDSVCVRVVVPVSSGASSSVVYAPLPNAPWDSVLLDLVGQSGISVPVHLRAVADLRNTFHEVTHVYEADVVLRDVDVYRPEGYVEFREGRWNPEGGLPPFAHGSEPLTISSGPQVISVSEDPLQAGGNPFALENYPNLPLCTELNVEGRWVPLENLPFDPIWASVRDNHNWVWLPYTCRLRAIPYAELETCLASKYPMMHWFGDSNLRRVMKKLVTGGQWCTNDTESRACLCEDYKEGFQIFDAAHREMIVDMVPGHGGHQLQANEYTQQLPEAGVSRIYFHKLEGLSRKNKPAWDTQFNGGIVKKYGRPQLAIVSLVTWDAAVSTRGFYAGELNRLLSYLEKEYDASTHVVLRTSQYFCCRSDDDGNDTRSFSRLRNAYFDSYTRRIFEERLGKYWSLDAKPAFVDIPSRNVVLASGDSVCVRVVVPPNTNNTAGNERLEFMPFVGSPWDSIMLNLVGQDTGVSVPVQLRMADHAGNYQRERVHIYEADVRLYDVDTYTAEGYIEYRNALWNPNEEFMEPQPFEPEPLAINSNLTMAVQDSNGPYDLRRYMDLPLCTGADNDGRWIPASRLPFDPSLVPEPDNHGLVWLPYDCRLQRYPYPEFAQCLINKHRLVHWMGDSNTRRALKKISSLGQWCSSSSDQASRECICNDNFKPFAPYAAENRISPFDLFANRPASIPGDTNDFQLTQSNRTRVVSMKWDGLSGRNKIPWREYLQPDTHNKLGNPSLVVLGGTAWDTAFESYSFFAHEVQALVQMISHTYEGSPDIVIRTGQHYCCTSDHGQSAQRRYSRLRGLYYNQLLALEFKRQFGDSVRVWDVSRITERRPIHLRSEDIGQCPANHVRSEIVDIENQVLFNALCN
ncbi:hypothetical protein GGF46_004830 [Coemansia sp. RSA 552]|nr:hypothetical protein GGF46_004830 [Coemansia sp. RSA 552]